MARPTGRAPGRRVALAIAVAIASLALLAPATCPAAGGRIAPADPAFLRFLLDTGTSRKLGLVPDPVGTAGLGTAQPVPVTVRFPQRYAASAEARTAASEVAAVGQDAAAEAPAAWDLRSTGKLSPVRDQGRYGTCWAFAALASLESSLLPAAPNDYSENNLAQRSGFALGYGDGGNSSMAAAYLLRWDGPVDEADDPYSPYASAPNASPSDAQVRAHVHDVLWLPARTSSSDNSGIKWAVMTYGAVYTTMCWSSGAYRDATDSYYSTDSAPNHAVDVVGWDDSYPASRFATEPAGPGAFLVRNSWGSSFGSAGYFWVSYYDVAFGKQSAVFAGAEAADPAERIYQHDPLGWVASYRPPNAADATTAWFAAAYTPAEDGTLTAAGFYAPAPGAAYEVRVAESVAGIRDAGVACSGTLTVAGYHTVTLDAPVTVAAGRPLVIAVRLTTPGYRFPVAIERPYGGYADATAAAGQSYVSGDGLTWTDMTALIAGTDVCLKGYGRAAASQEAGPSTGPRPAPTPSTPPVGDAPKVSLHGRAAAAGSNVKVAFRVGGAGTAATTDLRFTLRTRQGALVRRQTLHDLSASAAGTWKLRAPAHRGAYVVVAVATLDTGEVSKPATATLRVR